MGQELEVMTSFQSRCQSSIIPYFHMAYKCKHFLSQGPRFWSSSHERGFVTECNPAPRVPLTAYCSPFSLKDPLLCLLPITTSGHLRPTQETKDTGKDRAGLIPATCLAVGSQDPARQRINTQDSNRHLWRHYCV